MVAIEFGCSAALVSYHLSLLRHLPAAFVKWMRGLDRPGALRVLTQRQLRMENKGAQRRLLASLVQQAQARLDFADHENKKAYDDDGIDPEEKPPQELD
jgi:hypothetical protein